MGDSMATEWRVKHTLPFGIPRRGKLNQWPLYTELLQ